MVSQIEAGERDGGTELGMVEARGGGTWLGQLAPIAAPLPLFSDLRHLKTGTYLRRPPGKQDACREGKKYFPHLL